MREHERHREYEFSNGRLRVYKDGRCREFPAWCLMISVERPRAYCAAALAELRRVRRAPAATAAPQ